MAEHFDLVISGGTLIDPSQEIHELRDIGITGGRVARVAASLAPAEADERIDAAGLLVVPGLVDFHVHVFDGVGPWCIDPDRYCLARGTTTVLDFGSAGGLTMDGFRRLVIDRARTRIRALVHVSGLGLVNGGPYCEQTGELEHLPFVNVDWAVEAVERHRDVCAGVKVRLSRILAADGQNEPEAFRRAREAADRADCALMVHQTVSALPVARVLAALKSGDVWTHCFHGKETTIVDEQNRILPAVWEARQRGVLFDVGHGMGSFSWEIAAAAVEQDFWPDIISSDIHRYNLDGPVWDMPTTMSKFLHLGMPLERVVRASTAAPAAAMGLAGEAGTLVPGAIGDVTLLALETGAWSLPDSLEQTRRVARRLVLRGVVRGGKTQQIEPPVGL